MLVGMTVGSMLNYVGGRFVEGASGFDDVNPVDGSVVARVHEADVGLVDLAVRAARAALDGPVRQTARSAARVGCCAGPLTSSIVASTTCWPPRWPDTGKPHGQARVLDVARAATNFRSFADTAGGGRVAVVPDRSARTDAGR